MKIKLTRRNVSGLMLNGCVKDLREINYKLEKIEDAELLVKILVKYLCVAW